MRTCKMYGNRHSSGCVSRGCVRATDRLFRRPNPKSYCECRPDNTVPWKEVSACVCGENIEVIEWKWERPLNSTWVLVSDDQKTVTFHPFYSSGTVCVRGDTPMVHNNHYYWEVKMLSDMYGTDIMVGLCSDKADLTDPQFQFKSLLGQDSESYGLSYKGEVRHSANVTKGFTGFCRGTIVGVRLDMWAGTMEYHINRKSQGVSFYHLRRHSALFPILCSTAAQSSMKLINATSWQPSLQHDALKILNASLSTNKSMRAAVPPGIWRVLKRQVWLDQPDDNYEEEFCSSGSFDSSVPIPNKAAVLSEVLPSQYMNGFYMDNVERNYRVVLWE